MTLPWTGERYLPEIKGQIGLEHVHRYVMARELASRKIVLDIACGEGYGSAMLAEVASCVIGVDFSEDAVAHAQLKYRKNNLSFTTGSCSSIPLGDASVDLVTSFETIEHHDEHEAMMAEIKRVLRPNGCLIISSPEKLEYSDVPGYSNQFHVKELYRAEFEALLASHFRNIFIYGQRIIYGSAIFLEDHLSKVTSYRENDDRSQTKGITRPVYLIAIASDAKTQKASSGIYEQPHFESEVVVERDSRIASLAKEAIERTTQIAELIQTIAERDGHYAGLNQAVTERECQIAPLNQAIVERDGQVAGLSQAVSERENQIAVLNQTIIERDSHIASLNQAVTERASQIAPLNQAIVERDDQIASLNQVIGKRDGLIARLNDEAAERESQIAGLTHAVFEREESISRFTLQLDAERKTHHQSEDEGARRENALLAKSNQALQSLEKLVREHAKHDHESARQMQVLREQAEQDKELQVRAHTDREHALSQNHTEKERLLLTQLDAERKNNRQLEQGWRQLERTSHDEITGLRIEIEAQKHANQLNAQQYNYEISATKIERNLALQARNTIGARVFAEQQENNLLRQELTELHRYFAKIQTSFSWRLLLPLRKFGAPGTPPVVTRNSSVSIGHDSHHSRRIPDEIRTGESREPDDSRFVGQTFQSEHSANTLHVEEAAIHISTGVETNDLPPTKAPDCKTLMQYQGRQFIDASYITLLTRLPDADGLIYYLGRLHEGASKLQLLRELFFSQECRDAGTELPGLREAFSDADDLK